MDESCIAKERLGSPGFSYTLSLTNGKYKMAILHTLMRFGVVRFNEMKKCIGRDLLQDPQLYPERAGGGPVGTPGGAPLTSGTGACKVWQMKIPESGEAGGLRQMCPILTKDEGAWIWT